MQASQPKPADLAVATEPKTPAPGGDTLIATATMISASTRPAAEERIDWSVLLEEDSSFFMPKRCTPLDDF